MGTAHNISNIERAVNARRERSSVTQAPSTFDAAIAAMEGGSERVEAFYQRVDDAMLADKTPAAQARRDHALLAAQQQQLASEGRL